MSMHNKVQPHCATRPCRLCGSQTPALVRGQMVNSPVCATCSQELDRQFKVATLQRRRQESKPAAAQ